MATYYIATTGNDSTGNGTSGNPWQTISKAVTASASTGDTVNMAAGTYAWVALNFAKSINFAGPAATFGSLLPTAIIDASGTYPTWVGMGGSTFTDIMFQGVTMVAQTGATIFAGGVNSFTRCVMRNFAFGTGVANTPNAIFGTGTTLNLSQCVFYGMTTDISSGGNAQGYFDVSGLAYSQLNLTNCVFYNNDVRGIAFGARSGNVQNCTIVNSILYNLNSVAWTIRFGGVDMTFSGCKGNLVSGFSSIPANMASSVVLATDPLFVDPVNGNFNLRPTSPCIDAGAL